MSRDHMIRQKGTERLEFRQLQFRKIRHGELRPPISDNDHTSDDYIRGELLSLYHANKALQFVVRFVPGRDGTGWTSAQTEVQFDMLEKAGSYVGTLNRQSPERFCYLTGERSDVALLGRVRERPPAYGGRSSGTFFCTHRYGSYPTNQFSVTIMIRRGIFGGWREVVIRVPKKDLYVASL
jgi:hypothetical protein